MLFYCIVLLFKLEIHLFQVTLFSYTTKKRLKIGMNKDYYGKSIRQ